MADDMHLILILNRLREKKERQERHSQVKTEVLRTHQSRGRKTSSMLHIITKTKSERNRGVGGAGTAAVVKATGPNRTTQHRLKTRKQLSPRRTSSIERGGGVGK